MRVPNPAPDPGHRPTKRSARFRFVMKSFGWHSRPVVTLSAGFRKEQPGSPAFSRDRPFAACSEARIVLAAFDPLQHLPSPEARTRISPRTSAACSKGALATALPTQILSPLAFCHRRLSGSAQWRCIRRGSGRVQLLCHARWPNQCGYTTKQSICSALHMCR